MSLTQADLIRVHKPCGKMMKPFNCLSNPIASEFYCEPCHASEQMPLEVAQAYNNREMQEKRG